MPAITPSLISNRLGTVVSNPAASSNSGPTTGDIGADGTTPTAAVLRRVFDVVLTSTGGGDTCEFTIPTDLRKGIGLVVSIEPQNATAVTGAPFYVQTGTTVTLTFAAAAAGAAYRICFDAMHSITR